MSMHVWWGRYRNRRMTIERLAFEDYGYIWWMNRTFDADDPRREWAGRVLDIVKRKPIVVPCSGDVNSSCCNQKAEWIGIPEWNGIHYWRDPLLCCAGCKTANSRTINREGGCMWYPLSFDGLDQFIHQKNPPQYEIHNFGRAIARAYGLLDKWGRLTEERLEQFFTPVMDLQQNQEVVPAGKH